MALTINKSHFFNVSKKVGENMKKPCKVCGTEHEKIKTTQIVLVNDEEIVVDCLFCPVKNVYFLSDKELTKTYKNIKNDKIFKKIMKKT